GGIVAGFADADDGPAQEELEVAAREAGEEGGDAPDGHADADHGLADAAVAPVPEGDRGDRVNEKKGGSEEAEEGVADAELFFDEWARRGGDPSVHVVQEVDADHEGKDVPCIASRHGWNYEVGLSGRHDEAPRRDCVRLLRFSGSAGHWRAQVAVNHPRKLWGFKSLPAHSLSCLRTSCTPVARHCALATARLGAGSCESGRESKLGSVLRPR